MAGFTEAGAIVVSGDEVSVWRRLLALERRVVRVLTKGLAAEQMERVTPSGREIVGQIQLLDAKLGEEAPLDLLILWAAGIVARRHASGGDANSPEPLVGGVPGTQALGILERFCGTVECNELERARASSQIRVWVTQAKQEPRE